MLLRIMGVGLAGAALLTAAAAASGAAVAGAAVLACAVAKRRGKARSAWPKEEPEAGEEATEIRP
ncbi:hypothetical protein GXW78_06515 [Roseomonas terrae]|uniref:Uncharacterized protein n=1 Tax=Neoroseomonas terrae TaxID=424799 RepID=A0ABS5EE72_9PROT|nr:hypothetical protein [Neoroseomonas terrae]MBR0649307.1 hypothetical protein [Neoroseomonas terrae]